MASFTFLNYYGLDNRSYFPGNTSIASTLVLYSFVIAAGIYIGKVRIAGVSLGVTFVLFVGILMGHFGYTVDSNILKFVREFGLILFIFAIGIQVGPGFFSSFKKGGVTLNLLAVLGISLNVVIVVCIYLFGNVHDISALVGVMSGAVTNTPGLAAAQQAVSQITNSPEQANLMAQGYAAAYPLGVIGIILSMFVVKAVFRINVDDEIKQLEEEHDSSQLKPDILDIRVTNKLIEGKTLLELHDVITCNFVVSRIMTKDNQIIIPKSSTTISDGDILHIVCSAQDSERFHSVLGPDCEMDWETTPCPYIRAAYSSPTRNSTVWPSARCAFTTAISSTPPASTAPVSTCWLRPRCACRWAIVSPL